MSNEVLDSFFKEYTTLRQADNADTVAWTGMQLAAASERLRECAIELRAQRAAEMLVIARAHTAALQDSDMPLEALATNVVALLTVIVARANPEDLASPYLLMLQETAVLATAMAMQARIDDPDGHLNTIAGKLAALSRATLHAFQDITTIPSQATIADAMLADAIPALDAPSDVTATMAIDILADSAARLNALGAMK